MCAVFSPRPKLSTLGHETSAEGPGPAMLSPGLTFLNVFYGSMTNPICRGGQTGLLTSNQPPRKRLDVSLKRSRARLKLPSNSSINTDAQAHPLAALALGLRAGYFQR